MVQLDPITKLTSLQMIDKDPAAQEFLRAMTDSNSLISSLNGASLFGSPIELYLDTNKLNYLWLCASKVGQAMAGCHAILGQILHWPDVRCWVAQMTMAVLALSEAGRHTYFGPKQAGQSIVRPAEQ